MKFGVKTYYEEKVLDFFDGKSDFFEVQAIRGNDYSFLKKYKIAIVIHAEHQTFGVNFADLKKEKFNLDAISFAKRVADICHADKIIIHPGELENEFCSVENSINFIKKYCDKRFIIENMPFVGGKDKMVRVGSSPEEMKILLKETGLGFCFDINHAIEFALSNKLDYLKILEEFEKLKPAHYHLGGEKMKKKISHLCLAESDLDLKKVFSIVNKNANITLETNPEIKDMEKDLEIIEKFK